jgi:hypothetical protein
VGDDVNTSSDENEGCPNDPLNKNIDGDFVDTGGKPGADGSHEALTLTRLDDGDVHVPESAQSGDNDLPLPVSQDEQVHVSKPQRATGNSEYRKMLEAEERRHRKEKVTVLK